VCGIEHLWVGWGLYYSVQIRGRLYFGGAAFLLSQEPRHLFLVGQAHPQVEIVFHALKDEAVHG